MQRKLLALLPLIAFPGFGCGNGDMGETNPRELSLDEKIQKINDTKLPQSQKDTAIAMLKAHEKPPADAAAPPK